MERVALVMGGTRGLGKGVVDKLASDYAIALCARTPDSVERVVADLDRQGVRATGKALDVRDPEALEQLFDHVAEKLGKVSVLVTNAGGPAPGSVLDLSDEAWQAGFELTLMSAIRAIRYGVAHMRETGYGRIVMIGSSSVRQPIPNLGLSNALRPAVAGVMKSLAIDLAPEGITVNIVSPGRIDTERVQELDRAAAERRGVSAEEERARSIATIPMGRYGETKDLAAVVAFLASSEAGYVTGQSILVDGGLVRALF